MKFSTTECRAHSLHGTTRDGTPLEDAYSLKKKSCSALDWRSHPWSSQLGAYWRQGVVASSPYNDTRALALSTSAWCSASPNRSGSLSDIFSDKRNWRQSSSTSSRTNNSPVAFDPRVLLYIHASFLPSPTDSSQIACKVGWCPKVPCPNSIVYHFVPKNCHEWDIPPFPDKTISIIHQLNSPFLTLKTPISHQPRGCLQVTTKFSSKGAAMASKRAPSGKPFAWHGGVIVIPGTGISFGM